MADICTANECTQSFFKSICIFVNKVSDWKNGGYGK